MEQSKEQFDKKTLSSDDLTQRYCQCLNQIFTWGVFRNRVPVNRADLDLSHMQNLCDFFGNPQRGNFKIIHIAGTNGKGSCSLKTSQCLQKLGYKTGMFTSPHISSFRERIQINGQNCSMEKVVEACERIFKAVEENDMDVRFFEIVTMVGLLIFKESGCDYVVLECGLGGSLDATNIVQEDDIQCCAITSIGMDHMDVLGSDLQDIALEKAGIIKKGVPCILGPTCQLKPMYDRANEVGAQLIEIQKNSTFTEDNNQVVRAILNVVCQKEGKYEESQDSSFQELIEKTFQPCRFEIIQDREETIILDVCHNIDGFKAVIDQIKADYPQCDTITMVFGISKSKKLDEIIGFLEEDSLVKELRLVSRPHMRLYKAEDAHKIVKGVGSEKLQELILAQQDSEIQTTQSDTSETSQPAHENNIAKTLDYLLKENQDFKDPNAILLICGSFFIMSDVKQYFGYQQDIDPIM